MIHLLRNKQQQFYWLSVAKRGGSFAVIGRSSESYSQKHNCEKSVKAEAGVFHGDWIDVMDHTIKSGVIFYSFILNNSKWSKSSKQKVNAVDFNVSIYEIEFVQKLKK